MTISIDISDVSSAGSIDAALIAYCDRDGCTTACGVIGPSFATSGPGPGWTIQYDACHYAALALSDEYGATEYLDLSDGRLATGGYGEDIEWSDGSVVELVAPSIADALANPTVAREMAEAALDVHAARSDTAAWKRILDVLNGDRSGMRLQVSIYRRTDDERWLWCGDGYMGDGHIVCDDANLSDDVYDALSAVIDGGGEYTVWVDGEEYLAEVTVDYPE